MPRPGKSPQYECKWCHKWFVTHWNRQRHARKCLERSYQEKYITRDNTPERKAVICEVCGKGYATPTTLRRHIKLIHLKKTATEHHSSESETPLVPAQQPAHYSASRSPSTPIPIAPVLPPPPQPKLVSTNVAAPVPSTAGISAQQYALFTRLEPPTSTLAPVPHQYQLYTAPPPPIAPQYLSAAPEPHSFQSRTQSPLFMYPHHTPMQPTAQLLPYQLVLVPPEGIALDAGAQSTGQERTLEQPQYHTNGFYWYVR